MLHKLLAMNDIQHFSNINNQGGWDFESGTMGDLTTKRFVGNVTYMSMSSFSAGCMKSYHWDPIQSVTDDF